MHNKFRLEFFSGEQTANNVQACLIYLCRPIVKIVDGCVITVTLICSWFWHTVMKILHRKRSCIVIGVAFICWGYPFLVHSVMSRSQLGSAQQVNQILSTVCILWAEMDLFNIWNLPFSIPNVHSTSFCADSIHQLNLSSSSVIGIFISGIAVDHVW